MGSGSVAVVAEKINRRLYGMNKIAKSITYNLKWLGVDINPKYIQIAERRLKPFTDQMRLIDLLSWMDPEEPKP